MPDVHYPTWEEVGVPEKVVYYVRTAVLNKRFMGIIDIVVRHNLPKASIVYRCDNCQEEYKPQRVAEDYQVCQRCRSRCIRAIRTIRVSGDKVEKEKHAMGGLPKAPMAWQIGDEDRKLKCEFFLDIDKLLNRMNENYIAYFGRRPPKPFLKCNWNDERWYVSFSGGEQVICNDMTIAVARAAVLSPFLWDRRWDWKKKKTFAEPGKKASLISFLWQLTVV